MRKKRGVGGTYCRLGFSVYQDVLENALRNNCCGGGRAPTLGKEEGKLWTLIVHDEVKLNQDVVATNA